MGNVIDMSLQRFGRCFVLRRFGSANDGRAKWDALCDCGTRFAVSGRNLRSGHTQSCGCYQVEFARAIRLTHGHTKHKDRVKPSKTYQAWGAMHTRCYNLKAENYKYYGGKGIIVCASWHKFESFLADMGEAPAGLSLDRIQSSGNYEKRNCRWANIVQQNNNRLCIYGKRSAQ